MYKSISTFISVFSILFFTSTAFALSAVNVENCKKMENTETPFILVLNMNDHLLENITQCAANAKLNAASVSGLGQLHDPALAYFTSHPEDKPSVKKFSGFFELTNLTGNITNNKGQYYTHVHATLADKNFKGIAGHVDSATVGLTAEITIAPLVSHVEREVDAKTGFGPIVH